MNKKYNVEVITDSACAVPVITIRTSKEDETIREILGVIDKIFAGAGNFIIGYVDKCAEQVAIGDIISVRTEGRKILMDSNDKTYFIRHNLKEMEELLNHDDFCRISQSEIINLNKVKRFDLSVSGTISLELVNGRVSYVSRRQTKEVKKHIDKYRSKKPKKMSDHLTE